MVLIEKEKEIRKIEVQTRVQISEEEPVRFCEELGYWKVNWPRIKDKNKDKESKNEANLT